MNITIQTTSTKNSLDSLDFCAARKDATIILLPLVARSKLSQPAGVTHSLDSAYPHEYYYPNRWSMKPSLDTLFIVQMTNQKQGRLGRLGQHFSLSRPRTCADESIESAVLAVPH